MCGLQTETSLGLHWKGAGQLPWNLGLEGVLALFSQRRVLQVIHILAPFLTVPAGTGKV